MFANFNSTPTTTSSSGCPSIGGGLVTGASATQQSYRNTSSGTTGTTRCWQCDYSSTPSGGTGPNGGVVDSTYASSGSANSSSSYRYMYTETSSPNYPSTTFGFYLTSNSVPSGKTVTMKFWYYMYGTFMGNLRAYAHQGSTYKTTIASLNGQQQASQSTTWRQASGNYTSNSTTSTSISFFYTSGSSYTGDCCVDSVQIEYS